MSANSYPTAFTDEDLEEFKKALDCDGTCSGNVYLPHPKYRMLLERLKWAEKCADLCATDENCCNIPELGENDISPYYLWRKAAGKE